MKLRKIKLESGTWRYRIAKGGTITLWTPAGKKHLHHPDFCGCGDSRCDFQPVLGPYYIRRLAEGINETF